MSQITQRKNETQIEKSLDTAQLELNKKLDSEFWDEHSKQVEARRKKNLAHERELLSQIEQKKNKSSSPDLHLNKNYISNLK